MMLSRKATPKKAFRKLIFLWFPMVIAVYIYSWIPELISLEKVDLFNFQLAILVVAVVGIFLILVQIFYKRGIMGKPEADFFQQIADAEYPDRKNKFRRLIRRLDLQNMSLVERGAAIILYFSYLEYFIYWSLAESFVISGFVVTILSGDIRWVNYLALPSYANLLIFFPRRSNYESRIERWNDYVRRYSLQHRTVGNEQTA